MTIAKSSLPKASPNLSEAADPLEDQDLQYWETWKPEPPPSNLVFDDGEPLESNRHRIAMNALITSLRYSWQPDQDFFVGGNMFIYFSDREVFNKDFRGPDFFVALNANSQSDRQGWVVWQEGGHYPDIIIEILSDSTAKTDKTTKKELYERTFRTPDYFIFDPSESESFEGWHLGNSHYQAIALNDRGWLWSESLQLWLGLWEGEIERLNGSWLRFFDQEGDLILLPSEFAAIETERANREFDRANQESERANQEFQRANQALELAQAESQRAELEKQRGDRLAEKLRQLGIEPNL
jgi:Uma2 family endonuclease